MKPSTGAKDGASGSRGIGRVLHALHKPTAAEPIPTELAELLRRLDEADGSSKG